MSKGLKALNSLFAFIDSSKSKFATDDYHIIEKELKDYYKIKARLSVITMKIKSKTKECNNIIINTNEEDFMNVASEIELQTIAWFNDLLKEVIL